MKTITMSLALTPSQWALVEAGLDHMINEVEDSDGPYLTDDSDLAEELADLPALKALTLAIYEKRVRA